MADPTVTRKRLPVAERREVIFEAAGRLFGAHGYEGTILEQVAALSGVTKPILYRHFDSKQALYLALLERHRDDLDSFVPLIPGEGTLEERLRSVLDLWLSYVEAHAYAWQMLFRDSGGGPEVRAFRLQVHDRARAVLAAMIRSIGERPIPPREVEPTAEFMSMGMASLVLWWMDNPAVSRAEIVDSLTRVWTGLLAESA